MAYSQEEKDSIFSKILIEIENGRALRTVLKDEGMPSSQTFFIWIDEDEIKSKQYARSCKLRADAKFDDIENDYNTPPERDSVTGKIDTGWVALQRLKIDSKKWEASKLNPKKYGERLITEGTTTNLNVELTKEEAEKINKALEDKF